MIEVFYFLILCYIHKYLGSFTLNVKNTRCMTRNLFNVPRSLTLKSGKRLSIYLPQLVNKIIRYSHNLEFKDFKQYILFNISDLYLKFDLNFLHINC
jgi:hypothetical protein